MRNTRKPILTLKQILALPPGRHYRGQGLCLIVSTDGRNRRWIFRYTSLITHRPTETAIGSAFTFTHYEANNEMMRMRQMLAKGEDPVHVKRRERAKGTTFAEACEGWIAKHKTKWRSLRHIDVLIRKHSKPLADKPVDRIDTPMIVGALSDLWEHHPEQARRALSMWAQVFDYAKAMRMRTGDNPAAWKGNVAHIFPNRPKNNNKHHPSMPFEDVPAFIQRLRLRQVKGNSAAALEFLILTATRLGEVLKMSWHEVDLTNRIWTLPPARTKQGRQHRVPLSDRAMAILAVQNEYRTNDFVFKGRNGVALDEKAMRELLKRMKLDVHVVPHGFRSSFRNWAARARIDGVRLGRDLAELSLGHLVKTKTEAAYWTEDGLEERRPIMAAWASFCSEHG